MRIDSNNLCEPATFGNLFPSIHVPSPFLIVENLKKCCRRTDLFSIRRCGCWCGCISKEQQHYNTLQKWEIIMKQTLLETPTSSLGISDNLRDSLLLLPLPVEYNQTINNYDNTEEFGFSSIFDHYSFLIDNDDGDDNDNEENNELRDSFIFKGYPNMPFYKELAGRLYLLSLLQSRQQHCCGNGDCSATSERSNLLGKTQQQRTLLLPAERIGFTELSKSSSPSDNISNLLATSTMRRGPTKEKLRGVLQEIGDAGVLEILGMRQTVGTDPRGLLPPSRSALLNAAAAPHRRPGQKGSGESSRQEKQNEKYPKRQPKANNKGSHTSSKVISVAARARAKHAHRGKEQFFGIVKGGPEEQNHAAQSMIVRLLNNAVWINLHTFGGITDGNPILEVRVLSGYGARWKVEWMPTTTTTHAKPTSAITYKPTDVEFRGFLEPQMPDGHEKGWKH